MNLLGIKTIDQNKRVTLDKLNREIRHTAKDNNIILSILQSHSESKIVSHIQKNRKKVDHIIIAPGPWAYNGFVIKDLLDIIKKPYSLILDSDTKTIFDSSINKECIHISSNYIDAYIKCIQSI
jgi:3-dehydroquinate dehydratase|tara:strand:- start:72 stop:443 length:372 start_codon:yes stop_codon:yes gene_type:complete